jgi:two-component system chemotaxis sensor kinase CheA
MVVEDGGRRWGLLVDDILGQQQIVIKSLSESMGVVHGIAGASIMADGRPGLILDIGGVIKLATE